MQLPRFVGMVDLGIATVVIVAIFLPAREMYASHAIKGDEFAIAAAEARTIARPDDGLAVEDFTRKLGEAGMKDWAIEAATRASDRAKDSPTRWRALLAASVAFVDRLDVLPGLDYANRALNACEMTKETCPSWEEVKVRIFQEHLDAGVKSGIDPRHDPVGFRKAGEAALRQIHLGGYEKPQGSGSSAP